MRGMELAEAAGFRVRVVPLPAGRDPADILARGPEALEAVLAAHESVLSFRTAERSSWPRRGAATPPTRKAARCSRRRRPVPSATSSNAASPARSASRRALQRRWCPAGLGRRGCRAPRPRRRRAGTGPRERDEFPRPASPAGRGRRLRAAAAE